MQINVGWLLVLYFLFVGVIMAGGLVTNIFVGLILGAIVTGILCGIAYFYR